jgi:septal ring factor EnvC (AmiA/AmiB activator)
MLLNEIQKERAQMAAKITDQDAKISALERQLTELDDLRQALNAALNELRSKEGVVAKRQVSDA